MHYLVETRDGVVESVRGLSEAQWHYKPGADCWSAAEVVEHIALVEGLIIRRLTSLGQAPEAPPGRNVEEMDASVVTSVSSRQQRVPAPAAACPTGRWTPEEALKQFLANRAQIAEIANSRTDLRERVMEHPVLGVLDGHQWILAVGAHSERHRKQIVELKADEGYPQN